jgi:hypothetical protein
VDAAKVQFALSEMGAQWSERSGRVSLDWGPAWDGASTARRLALMHAFAQGDACLSGQIREITFHRRGRLVATASLREGIALLDDAAQALAGAACR